jgi:transcriptional regulator with XRE-family HTH domain
MKNQLKEAEIMIFLTSVRKEKGISQNRLSYIAQVPQSQISSIENGKTYAHPGYRRRIAEALDWDDDVNKLFQEVQEDEQATVKS